MLLLQDIIDVLLYEETFYPSVGQWIESKNLAHLDLSIPKLLNALVDAFRANHELPSD